MQILTVSGLQKTYTTRFGSSKVQALKNVNFTVESGEYVAIMGESGSGKTTLLNILAALDKPTGGTVLLGGKNLSEIPEETAAAFRRDNLGFVFQDFSLLDTFSLEDNICLPLVLAGVPQSATGSHRSPTTSASRRCSKSTPTRSPADRSSAPPSPARSSPARRSCWPTSRPARSTPARPTSS